MFEDSDEAMKADSEMGQSYRLDDLEDHCSLDQIAWRVLSMGFVGLDVKIEEIPRSGFQWRGQSGQQRTGSRGMRRQQRRWSGICAHVKKEDNDILVAKIWIVGAKCSGYLTGGHT